MSASVNFPRASIDPPTVLDSVKAVRQNTGEIKQNPSLSKEHSKFTINVVTISNLPFKDQLLFLLKLQNSLLNCVLNNKPHNPTNVDMGLSRLLSQIF